MSKIDTRAIEEHIRGILIALGDDPTREGLADTPKRVAKMYAEVFEGMNYTNHEIAQMFNKTFEDDPDSYHNSNDIVVVKDIEVFSYCEHHMALMYNMNVSVAYIPNGKVIGLSKIARIADMVAKRLQLQERIGSDIAEIMQEITDSPDAVSYTHLDVYKRQAFILSFIFGLQCPSRLHHQEDTMSIYSLPFLSYR